MRNELVIAARLTMSLIVILLLSFTPLRWATETPSFSVFLFILDAGLITSGLFALRDLFRR